MSNGKGDTPRPFSVDQETFNNNWDRIFNNSNEDIPDIEYTAALRSGLFWELFPELTGYWKADKLRWKTLRK
jgi:hypothetical protein